MANLVGVTLSERVVAALVVDHKVSGPLRYFPESDDEYALVEILSASDINQSVWDFRVDPSTGDNPGSLGPLLK